MLQTDLVCIAGDLLDMFNSETRMEQAREITRLVRELADLVPVAVCSGNHDNAGRLASNDRASVYEWFRNAEIRTRSELAIMRHFGEQQPVVATKPFDALTR